tara:strand:+ start:4576 stop:6156 length:1581 start_codon:yes stop_codon:yes gene_type:complete
LFSFLFLLPNLENTSNPGQGDEVMHIATVQDSLASGSYLYPELNGFVNYYKPPLLFWLSMASERGSELLGLGDSLLGERFISLAFSAVSAILIFELLLLFRTHRYQAFMWALLYLSTLGVLKFARLLMFEQIMAAHILGTLYVFALWLAHGGRIKLLFLGFLVGSSYLYKGALVPIYLVLGLSVWAIMQWYRTSGRFKNNLNLNAIWPVARTGLWVIAGALLPLVGYAAYLLGHPKGLELINYFLVFENAAKFVDANQGEWILFQGIILYTLPWTFLLGGSLRSLFRSPAGLNTPSRQFALLLVLAFSVVLLFHFIPHRKADYYMLPLFGLLFVAAGLAPEQRTRSTQWLVLVLSLVSAGALTYLDHLEGLFFLLPGALAIYALRLEGVSGRITGHHWKMLIPGLTFSAMLPVLAFPALFPPVLSQRAIQELKGKDVCVITENPWSALSYRAVLGHSDMSQRHPDLASECQRASYIIEHDTARVGSGYRALESYPVWKDASFQDYLENLSRPQEMQRKRVIYEKAH